LVAVLPSPKVVLATPITIVAAPITIVVASIIVAIVAVSIITPIIRAAILLVGARSLTNIFLDLLIGLVSICPLLCHHE
jgi:hypothetical protein